MLINLIIFVYIYKKFEYKIMWYNTVCLNEVVIKDTLNYIVVKFVLAKAWILLG